MYEVFRSQIDGRHVYLVKGMALKDTGAIITVDLIQDKDDHQIASFVKKCIEDAIVYRYSEALQYLLDTDSEEYYTIVATLMEVDELPYSYHSLDLLVDALTKRVTNSGMNINRMIQTIRDQSEKDDEE